VTSDPWKRATFAGTEQAQADVIADLTPDERVVLLEQLLDMAAESGALANARERKQAALDALWTGTPSEGVRRGHESTGTGLPDDPA
jgi:hypothetical protein